MWADLVLADGNVLTMNPSQSHAKAIAIKKDRIVKVGTNKEISRWIGKKTKTINLKGRTVVPGLIDTHVHVADFGKFLTWVDLRAVKSIKEIQTSLKKRAQKTPKGKWIIGHGWDQNCFSEGRLPTHHDLDVASSDNPVILYHQCGQLCVVNSKALELAGVTKQTSVTPGGAIDKSAETGELTGVLRDDATNLVWKMVPELSEEELVDAAGLACETIVEAGVTSVHWIVSSLTEISIIQRLRVENKLPLRIYIIVPANLLDSVLRLGSCKDFRDNVVEVCGVMVFADGSLAARTAALLQPYSDDPATKGKLLCTQEEMNALVGRVHKANLQLIIHAMGDQAIDAALVAIEKTSTEAPRKNRRYRLEQAALLNKGLIQRIKKQEVTISVQPRVIASEFSVWSATEHLGPRRARWLYPLKTLLKEGIRVIGGSDCPMEPLSPLLGIQAAVAREFFPEERFTVDEALRMYTVDAAYASFEESVKGSIEAGKLADLAVISHDPRTVSPNEIGSIRVEMTIVGGKVVYSKRPS
jgi:predicted amidohydrolase YtcJ